MCIERVEQRGKVVDLQYERGTRQDLKGEYLPGVNPLLAVKEVPQNPPTSAQYTRYNVDLHVVLVVELADAQVHKVIEEEQYAENGHGDS